MSFLWYWPAGGWDFDAWKAKHPWEPIRTQQSGNARLAPLVSDTETLAGWERDARYWREVSDGILGQITDRPPKEVKWEWIGAELTKADAPAYTLRRMRYRLTDDEWGYAWLLRPKGEAGKRPAVIALHQTDAHGKHHAVGIEIDPDRRWLAYGAELAERGFVVFAPDAIAFGERQGGHGNAKYHSADEFFAAHPDGGVMRKMAFDTSRAVDVLEQLPGVDAKRIGCIGHSHGGYGTLFAMLADNRIKAGVISCGVTLLRADPNPERWWRRTALIPRLGYYEGKIDQTPIDYHVWLALVAPRPLTVVVGTEDQIFPNTAPLKDALEEVRKVYMLYGAGDKLTADIFAGPHTFPDESRTRAYQMLEKELNRG